MATIGILPSLTSRPHMLARLARDSGLVLVKGRHSHLVKPGQKVKAKPAPASYTGPYNGGGAAA